MIFNVFLLCNIISQRLAVSVVHGVIDREVLGADLPLDILAGLYISSVFFVKSWYEGKKKRSIENLFCFVVAQSCFNWNFRSSPCFTVSLAAWACKIWSVLESERKEDCGTVCVLCTQPDFYHQIWIWLIFMPTVAALCDLCFWTKIKEKVQHFKMRFCFRSS